MLSDIFDGSKRPLAPVPPVNAEWNTDLRWLPALECPAWWDELDELFEENPTPIARIDVQDGLGESPAMAGEVLRSVLSFTVGIVGRRIEDAYTQRCNVCVMVVYIGDAHHD